jgi:hypothetical protein
VGGGVFGSNPTEERVHLGGGFWLGLLVDVLVSVLSEADVRVSDNFSDDF